MVVLLWIRPLTSSVNEDTPPNNLVKLLPYTTFDHSSDAIKSISNPKKINKLISPCLRNPAKLQISAINDEAIDFTGKEQGLNETEIKQLKDLQNENLLSKYEVKDILFNINYNFKKLIEIWDTSGLGRLQLTTVGIALAHANIKKTIGIDLDLGVWIK